jgi:hypothetical protein
MSTIKSLFAILPAFLTAFLGCLSVIQGTQVPLTAAYEVTGVSYQSSIPRPDDLLGYTIGQRHTRPDQIVRYFEMMATASDRVVFREHGRTYGGRPLIHALVSSPSNLARLEDLRRQNLQLSDNPGRVSDRAIDDMPVVILMGYSVHGNEASGSEAAMLLLYHLAAGQGSSVENLLNKAIILIDPMLNPDGRSRFVNWVNWNRGRVATTDPTDREHNEPWPGGRTNHYWFDLNRDWLPAQLKESRSRLKLFHSWRPQLLTDFHEMGSESTFFFQPGVPTRDNPNTPGRTQELTRRIARYHARYLDRIGSLYFSEETFDDFYYGKGSTYPDINGSVGILFEQASARSLARETSTGLLRFDFTIRNQFTASLSTLEAALNLRKELLENQRDFYLEAEQTNGRYPFSAFVFRAKTADSAGVYALLDVLLQHRIKVYQLKSTLRVGDGSYPANGSYIVPMAQPQGRLLKILMETVTEFRDPVFYDVATWTLPLAFDVAFGTLSERNTRPYLGNPVTSVPSEQGQIQGGPAEYAYLLEWDFWAARSLYGLQSAGVQTRLVTTPFQLEVEGTVRDVQVPAIVVPVRQDNLREQQLHRLIETISAEEGGRFLSLATGHTKEGPDLGSPSVKPLQVPKIALATGRGVSSSQAGSTWFLLDERMSIPVSLVDQSSLAGNLNRYNVVILVNGSYADLGTEFPDAMKSWVRSGGTLIAIQGAIRWLLENQLIEGVLVEFEKPSGELSYSDARQVRQARRFGGAILETELDTTHPLVMGLSSRLAFFRNHDLMLQAYPVPGTNVACYSDSPLLSGYLPEDRLAAVGGTAAVVAVRVGSGSIILFTDDPNFRAFWLGTSRLFLNAVFFGSQF